MWAAHRRVFDDGHRGFCRPEPYPAATPTLPPGPPWHFGQRRPDAPARRRRARPEIEQRRGRGESRSTGNSEIGEGAKPLARPPRPRGAGQTNPDDDEPELLRLIDFAGSIGLGLIGLGSIGLRLIGLGLAGLGLVGFGLVGFGPCRFLGARRHPAVVFGRAAPRRHTGRLATHPMRHVRQMLARGLPGARRQQNADKAEQGPFGCQEGRTHLGVVPPECGDQDAQSWPGCDGGRQRR
jgi:hypothetical protein